MAPTPKDFETRRSSELKLSPNRAASETSGRSVPPMPPPSLIAVSARFSSAGVF
jgi:hypothetical protein